MKNKNLLLAALCGIFTAGSVWAADPAPSAIDPEADRLLRAACAHLSATKAFSFKAEVWEDAVVFGHKVATTKTVETRVRRPHRVQVEIRSPKRSRGLWYDGQSLTLLDRRHNLYGTVPVPETIDKVLDAANDKFGINFPLEDLLVNDPYASASAAIKGGVFFGKVTSSAPFASTSRSAQTKWTGSSGFRTVPIHCPGSSSSPIKKKPPRHNSPPSSRTGNSGGA